MRIGIDLGGTKIEGIVLDGDGTVLARERRPTPFDYLGTVKAICDLVEKLEGETGVRATVGIGIPGTVSPATGLVKNANSTWLNGRPFDRDLAAALGRPVRMANDANCFAISEATDGAAAAAGIVFGIILGTGCGGGIVVDGRVLVGQHGIAGEWGHNPLPWPRTTELPGRLCFCGRRGCLETWVSGPALLADYPERCGGLSPADIFARSRDGDVAAQATIERYLDRLARGLASVVNVLDPDVIVVGGGLSNADVLYTEIPARLPIYVFSDVCVTPVRKSHHGDASGVRGAAWLWPGDAR